ncbi:MULTISPECIES: hypothetical protein [Bacillus cereus group]|uniref:hypothetical protein n=1 Tax=Bacillus cereus group TaxID=86661 RepID=UPI00124D51B0|nr:hypothetical protein [Bacillus cereus]KAB2425451.1 hypothetical protein F8167_00470 [Bacillus cereus]
MANLAKGYTNILKGKGEGYTIYFHSIGECRFVQNDMIKVYEYIFNFCNMENTRKIELSKTEKRDLIYITGKRLGNIRDRIIYPLENLGFIHFNKGEWTIELADPLSLRNNPYLLLTKLERLFFKYISSKHTTNDSNLLQLRELVKNELTLEQIQVMIGNKTSSPDNSIDMKALLITYNDKLKEKANRTGIKTTVTDEWLSQVIKELLLSESEVSSIKKIERGYLTKDTSEWELINFAEYFIFMYEDFTGKSFNRPFCDLVNDIDTVYRWNGGKLNQHEVVKEYINLFFIRCKNDSKLSPNSALFANRKNCKILDGMYEFKKKEH